MSRNSLRAATGFLAGLCSVLPSLRGDEVTAKNGERLTGKIVKLDGGRLTMESATAGAVTVSWDQVREVSSEGDLTVVLPDGRAVKGRLRTEAERLVVATAAGVETAPIGEVQGLRNADEQKKYERLEKPSVWELWAGYFDIGASLARGNADTTTFTTAMNASRLTRNDKATAYFNQIYGRATVNRVESTNAEAIRGGWAYNHNLKKRMFVNGFNDYEYDRFQNLDLRFVAGGGLGVTVLNTERNRLDLLGGASYNREQFNTGLVRNSAEAYWGDDWIWKLSGGSAMKQSFRMFNNLSSPGDYRVNFDIGLAMKLSNWLAWQITLSDRYLTNPLAGKKTNDVLASTGLRITFVK